MYWLIRFLFTCHGKFTSYIPGAGGAIYVRCSHISKICNTILKSQLGFPLFLDSAVTGSQRTPKIRLEANSALWFGSNVASDPAELQIINLTSTVAGIQESVTSASEIRLVPGQGKLSLNALVVDGLSQVVRGLDYTCRILICPSETVTCNEAVSLLPPTFISMDLVSGMFRLADIPLACPSSPTDEGNVIVQISLLGLDFIFVRFSVVCMPCRDGQARTLGTNGRAWRCASCSPTQYVIDPNNPSFGCKVYYANSVVVMLDIFF
jgi:hypothetical protein